MERKGLGPDKGAAWEFVGGIRDFFMYLKNSVLVCTSIGDV